jgi:AraC family transcriptional regulator of adaptative response/methylated-DNA-[protein]-cysteine methyltransferase
MDNLPIDVRGTEFQERVWRELRAIPYGSTRSYSEVARAIGHPSAVRAVAHACGLNHVALVIPCHRVVREDGSLGGYKWGIERKEAILAREHSLAQLVAREASLAGV